MDAQSASYHYHTPEEWESFIGGVIGEEFKKSLSDDRLLADFVKLHPFEANKLEYSYEIYFKIGHPKLSPAIYRHLSPDQIKSFQKSYPRPDANNDQIL